MFPQNAHVHVQMNRRLADWRNHEDVPKLAADAVERFSTPGTMHRHMYILGQATCGKLPFAVRVLLHSTAACDGRSRTLPPLKLTDKSTI
jgi:hypothetical protein